MKKIFAIALALVMVLSMASAFATTCPTINWDCATYTCETGKGSVEVIPYVKGNACGKEGVAFTPNTCAGAVNTEEVYFAVKVTVEADPSEDWWNEAVLTLSTKGLETVYAGTTAMTGLVFDKLVAGYVKNANEDELKAGEYYLVYGTNGWEAVKAADYTAEAATLFSAKVDNATIAKVCAKLTSEADVTGWIEINGYDVNWDKALKVLTVKKAADKYVEIFLNADTDKVEKFEVKYGAAAEVVVDTYSPDKSAFWTTADEALSWTCTDAGKFLKAVMDAFKLDFGTCITDKAVKANFAWEDKVENCFSWSDKVQAVVDAECVVAIPKTGDASVLAWLF